MSERLSLGTAFGSTGLRATDGSVNPAEETLVMDARAGLRPAEMVEQQLMTIMRGMPVHISHERAWRLRRTCP